MSYLPNFQSFTNESNKTPRTMFYMDSYQTASYPKAFSEKEIYDELVKAKAYRSTNENPWCIADDENHDEIARYKLENGKFFKAEMKNRGPKDGIVYKEIKI